MNKLGLMSMISRNLDVVSTKVDDDLVMLHPDECLFFGVNSVGARIWSLLEKTPLQLNTICEHIHQNYEVEQAQCREDVTRFIDTMVAKNLLVITEIEPLF